ncbi:alpha-glucan family phosphorylase [Tunicatimonas pelagia]|uniref:alpha-glucan family phosphorylase n=1 Tax=Tunicatimonas pelagia TaxID=931531 RepID=UPI002666452A|nr:alpha-glucan family phosphorylase [Tunicatimonas pelagia]WKN44427.1 alpha-glucan family phosphorylase [Tunicatimonas pelagia]
MDTQSINEGVSPHWKRLYIQSQVPDKLKGLEEISKNLWWCWNYEAINLFRSIDPEGWLQHRQNPIALLDNLNYQDYERLLKDSDFMKQLTRVQGQFKKYMGETKRRSPLKIGYFCMEYGLHSSLKLYSGGLGVLAGDYLKEASDENVDMVAVGLLYRYGYFRQGLSHYGEQVALYDAQRFTYLPVEPVRNSEGTWIKIQVELPERVLYAKLWKVQVGRMPLYLLDADIEDNQEADRVITHHLYGGDRENRLKQELLLGIGGMRALQALDVHPDIYHLNEGHAAFNGLERLRILVKSGLSYDQAVEVIRSSSLFTTHTPVPAGHDSFSESMLWPYLSAYTNSMSLSWEKFMALGRIKADNKDEEFSMSHLALKLSQEVNGVSKIHGQVSRKMFQPLFPGFEAEELHIGYVTNGVHYYSWTSQELQELYEKTFGKSFLKKQSDPKQWEKIHDINGADLINIKRELKKKLIDTVKKRLERSMQERHESPQKTIDVLNSFDENTLIFGFARRFATYKRAQLLFRDVDRLARIVNNPDCPVQFIFAGKAHPADQGGQELIRRIVEVSNQPEFFGKVVFLEDYDIELTSRMVKGVDVWLNTPTRPLEASGTSGMKATLNGTLNLSVLDGWWAEGYQPDTGWALDEERTYENQDAQNELDAATIYAILENELIPQYYDQNEEGVSEQWLDRMKKTIAQIAPEFTMKRMMDDYFERFYNKLGEQRKKVHADDFAGARELAEWKGKVVGVWNQIRVLQKSIYDFANDPLPLGENFKAEIILDIKNLASEDVGVELLVAHREEDEHHIVLEEVMSQKQVKKLDSDSPVPEGTGTMVKYTADSKITFSGVYEYGFRVFPQHPLLASQQDFNLVTWL